MSIPAFTFTSRAAPFVEVGVGDTRTDMGVARWDVAHWDNVLDATWSGAEPLWVDETCHGYSIELAAGRQRNTDTFTPATATITLENTSGWADETLLTLRPGRSLRVGIYHAELGPRVLFRGIVDAVAQSYSPESGDSVEISAVCALGEVGRVRLGAVGDPGVGAGETGDDRVRRILDAAKWPASKRDVAATAVSCTATKLGQQVADMFNIVAESTGGAVYGDTVGNVAYRGKDWQMFLPGTPPDATIGNVSASDVCPSEYQLGHRRDDLVTQCVLARQGVDTTPHVYDDATGQQLYGLEVFQATDLVCDVVTQLNVIAARTFRVRGGAASAQRVERVLFDTATADAALDLATTVSAYDPPSRYRARLTLARGVVFDDYYLVTGIRHSMTPDTWTCDLDLDRSAPFSTSDARWDDADWNHATWAAPTLMEVA